MPSYRRKLELSAWGLFNPGTDDLLATCRSRTKTGAIHAFLTLSEELRGNVRPCEETVRALP